MNDRLLTVSQLNEYLQMLLDGNSVLTDLWVQGEISNFTDHRSGHFYFSVKDESALIRAVMFRSYARRLRFLPENGMKVLVHGRVSLFPRDGQVQLYADDMRPDGVGALYVAFEQLRRKLEAEGLFDQARKRPLPDYPMRIGIVTSPTGAAVRDMIQILGRRFPVAAVYLYPALVQGSGAPESLAAGLDCFARRFPVDLVIIGRGGGSAEDLWAFNDEALVRAVAACPIPTVSAVGHETDTTLCDFAADLRAPTPSAAAELAVPDIREVRERLRKTAVRLTGCERARLAEARAALGALRASEALRSPRYYLENKRMQLAYAENRLAACVAARTAAGRSALGALAARMEGLNPLGVLSRGYAAVFDEENKLAARADALAPGQKIRIRFADGSADATVTRVRESE